MLKSIRIAAVALAVALIGVVTYPQGGYVQELNSEELIFITGAVCSATCTGPCSGIPCKTDPWQEGRSSDGGNICVSGGAQNCTLSGGMKVQCRWFDPSDCGLAYQAMVGKEYCEQN